MLMSEKLYLANDGHFHEHKFEGALERLRLLLPKFLQSTVQRILHKDLGLHSYKIRIVQQLNERDCQQRLTFCQTMLDMFEENENLTIIMSNERSFLSRFVFVKIAIICQA